LELAGSLSGHKAEVTALDFAPDGKTIASSSQDGSVKLWDVATAKLKRTLTDVKNSEWPIAFNAVSADRKMAFSGAGEFHIRDLSSGKIIKTLTPTQNGISQEPFPDFAAAAAFSPDGKRLAVGDGCGSVFLFSVATGKVIPHSRPPTETIEPSRDEVTVSTVNAIAFAPDGKTFAVGTDTGAIEMLDAETQRLKFAKLSHANQVASVTFSPDGRILVSGSYDRTVKLWDAVSGRLLVTLMILPAEKAGQVSIEWIAFTPQGYYSASSGAARFIRWRVGDKLLPAESYAREFNRPERVRQIAGFSK
jgi:WD40 repeat protein